MPPDPSQDSEPQHSPQDGTDLDAKSEASAAVPARSPGEIPQTDRTFGLRLLPLQQIRQVLQNSLQTAGQTLQKGGQWLTQWFQIGEADLQQLLEQVRQSLPTAEVILIGKAQTGKSSIVRAMTGASVEIVGQGFRPHTAHTQRYAYPTEDLTLLNFIDTIGLGEGLKDPQSVLQDLQQVLSGEMRPDSSPPAARVLVATVKIADFAIDRVHQLLQALRREHPQVPCLLVVTCIHDLYPAAVTEHPPYPPDNIEVQRAYAALQNQLRDVYDRSVLVDFTLEEDGYTPVLYGLEAFIETLAALMPDAEAQAIHRLLARDALGDRIGNMYRDAGRRYVLPFSIMAATLAAVPLPLATMPVLTALQVSMVTLLGRLYGQTLSPSQAGGVASAIAGGFAAQVVGRELVKFIPGLGSAIAASWAGAYTWALGEGACVYFGDLMGGKTPDPQKIQKIMKESFKSAQERFKKSATTDKDP
ncbi:YcjF family protein [Altericista sp. CCNU0014]|uniref:YcjF family protein n=1 Tax=Altericista sp. CCNU0014 TaxID=3082949 RepID=UPI00384E8CB4